MNAGLMGEYINFVADRLLVALLAVRRPTTPATHSTGWSFYLSSEPCCSLLQIDHVMKRHKASAPMQQAE